MSDSRPRYGHPLPGLSLAVALCGLTGLVRAPGTAWADGKIVPPRDYQGSLEESAQEAIIIFQGSDTQGKAAEDLILKIKVHGSAKGFAWIIPFPAEPKIAKEDPKLFRELFRYVEARTRRRYKGKGEGAKTGAEAKPEAKAPVEVLSRRIVGSYDTAVVRENVAGALNKWLAKEGFQTLPDAEDVVGFYRKKGYVFACVKVSDAELEKGKPVDSHPLRFSFKTGGRDGIFYPMRMTGLQSQRFDVNLYVFYRYWINDRKNRYGYVHRGFRLRHRDWDTSRCVADGGKAWSAPETDPFLRDMAYAIPTVKKLFQTLHPGERYYLTNIQAFGLVPSDVREWADDLWLFPYYTNPKVVPFDARPDGPASTAWPEEADAEPGGWIRRYRLYVAIALGLAAIGAAAIGIRTVRQGMKAKQ